LSQFRQTWKDSQRTASKKVERLRALFSFAFARKWVEENPAKAIKLPKVSICPTMPLTHDEMLKLLTACDGLQVSAKPSARLRAHRLKTLILLMRYTGMRVSDAVTFSTDRLDGKRLFLYTQKTGVPVYTVLPDSILNALEATPRLGTSPDLGISGVKNPTIYAIW
jgi:site-specific recombinase XerD